VILPIATDVTVVWSVHLYVCMYVCVVCHTCSSCESHVGWNEMPFGKDTYVIPTNIVLDRSPSHHITWKRRVTVHSDAASHQITLSLVVIGVNVMCIMRAILKEKFCI